MKFNTHTTLGDIVTAYPNAAEVFNTHHIDYCCNGGDTLGKAVDAINLDENLIISQLNEVVNRTVQADVTNWSDSTMSEMVDYIVNRYHKKAYELIGEIQPLLSKIMRVHYQSHGEELLHLHHLFSMLLMELDEHFAKEEASLFPQIKAFDGDKNDDALKASVIAEVIEAESEHDAAGDLIKEIDSFTHHFVAPEDGCNSYKRVFNLMKELEEDTFRHIHMENSILFKYILDTFHA
jgi:regulator of cell morphogenesis and NO signaling